jgi:hypothetical protein
MSAHWRIAATTLAVLWATAGFGLWQKTQWGLAIWVAASLLQVSMHSFQTDLYGRNDLLITFLAVLAVVYSILWFNHAKNARKANLAKR